MRFIRLIAWKEFAHIKADPLMSRLIVFPVLAQLFIIGYALTTEVKHTPIAFVDHSGTPQSASLIATIRSSDLFVYRGAVSSELGLRTMMDRGEIRLGLVIPAEFAADLARADARVHVIVDGQDANSSSVANGYLNAIVSGWTFRYLKHDLAAKGIDIDKVFPLTIQASVLFNPLLQSSWYMIPALVVLLVTIVTALLTGFSIVKEKERGTFEQLMVTPIRPIHIVVGKIIPFVVIGLGEICVFLLLATLWFGIPFRGDVGTLALFALIYMLSSLGIGILASTIVSTSQQVLFVIWFLLIFFILLSGFFIPVENMPPWVQGVTAFNPVRFFMYVVREIFLKGSGLAELWREAVAMAAIGAVTFTIAVASFTRRAK